jgi:Tfp pilus assembly protein PilV
MQTPVPRRQRGLSLVEALLAFVILSLGMLAVVRLQPALRQHADVARQRSEAVRLAQQDIETQRIFADRTAFEALADSTQTLAAGTFGSPRYELQRRWLPGRASGLRELAVTVSWTARDGSAQHVALATQLSGVDPALAAALLLPRP